MRACETYSSENSFLYLTYCCNFNWTRHLQLSTYSKHHYILTNSYYTSVSTITLTKNCILIQAGSFSVFLQSMHMHLVKVQQCITIMFELHWYCYVKIYVTILKYHSAHPNIHYLYTS